VGKQPKQWGASFLLLAMTAFGASGCQQNSGAGVVSGDWVLSSVDGGTETLPENTAITISFEDGSASGFSGCNSFQFSYNLTSDGNVTVTSGIALTKMACRDESLMNFEAFFVRTLASAETLTVDNNTLVLSDTSNGLVFEKAPDK
jgi:heat shock protein HslJ